MSLAPKVADLLANMEPVTRRSFLRRSLGVAVSVPVVGSLLAACGDDDDDPTPTTAPAADPTPTEAVEEEEEATEEPEEEETEEPVATEEPEEETEEPEEEATEEPEEEETEEPETGGAKQGGVITLMGHHSIDSLSPDDVGRTVEWVAIAQIHNALLQLDAWYVLQPTLCDTFSVSDDGLEYTFNLVEGVKWHDGEDFTAEDVVYTFDYYRNPDNAAITASNYQSVESVEAVDDYTVVVKLDSVNAAFLTRAGQCFIVPEHHHSVVGEDAYKVDPIGTGPYYLVEQRAAEYVELRAFEDFFLGRANIDTVRINIVPEASVRAIALETQEADSSIWSLVNEDHVRFENDPAYTTFVTSSLAVNNFPINHERPQFAEKVVRQALMHAIDRDEIVNDLWMGMAVKATANLSPALEYYYEPNVRQYDYDPELAAQMLEEAGWVVNSRGVREKNGVELAFTCGVTNGDQERRPIAELLQQYFLAINVEMSIEEIPSPSSAMRAGEADMGLHNWTYGGSSGEPDPSNVLRSDALNNFNHYKSAEMDALLDRGLAETDPEKRREIYSEVQKLFAEDVPMLFIKFWDWYTIFTPRVKGLPESILAGSNIYTDIYKFWIEE